VSLPKPEVGLVIRYSYLWPREHREGREEGTKDRPCAIVLVAHRHDGETRVLVFPSRIARPRASTPRSSCRPPSSNTSASTPNARGWSSPKAICSTGPAPICAASAIATTARSPTGSCRRASSTNCAGGFSRSKTRRVHIGSSGQNEVTKRERNEKRTEQSSPRATVEADMLDRTTMASKSRQLMIVRQ